MYDTCKELNRDLNISGIGKQMKALWQVAAEKEADREWYDSTTVFALHLQDSAKALDEATRRRDEGFLVTGLSGP